MKLVVADNSPLIVLARSNMLGILRQVVGEVVITQTVYDECTGELDKPGARIISEAYQTGLVTVHPDSHVPLAAANMPMLDKGGISTLALALELGEPALMDERLGRQAAVAHGIAVIGSAGILLAAKQKGVIEAVQPILLAWQGVGYFLAPSLIAHLLQRAGESPELEMPPPPRSIFLSPRVGSS